MSERKEGVVKWFSNKKGYGFITPRNESEDDIFCHQSVIHSEGYRTLAEGWEVEYSIEYDENNKPKADNVTAIGGGFCDGPRSVRRRRKRTGKSNEGDRVPQPLWHESLTEEAKNALDSKGISRATGTLDLALGGVRIKLGTRNYAALAQDDRVIAEGAFVWDEEGTGHITCEWKRAIRCGDEGYWTVYEDHDLSSIISEVFVTDDAVEAVGQDENMITLMGEDVPDPKSTLESAGFEMRRVVISARRR